MKVIPIIYKFLYSIDDSKIIKFIEKLNRDSFGMDIIYPKLKGKENLIYYKKFVQTYNLKLKNIPQLNGKLYLLNKYINTCLYGKVAIALNGDIMPCQNARQHVLGNITVDSLSDILKKGFLNRYWYNNKGMIEGCKDCEFRYCCTDCLILTNAFKKDIISKNIFCNYFPDKGIWENI